MADSDRNDLRANSSSGSSGNPLHIPRDVDKFVEDHKLVREGINTRLLLKGAMILEYEDSRSGPDLKEKAALEESDLKLLRDGGTWEAQPWELFVSVFVNCIAAIIQGWGQSGTNAANLFWPQSLIKGCNDEGSSVTTYSTTPTAKQSASQDFASVQPCKESLNLLIGLVNAAPYIMVAVIASWLSVPFNDWFGRRRTVFIGTFFSVIAPICSSLSQTWPQLFGSRLLLGLGMGLKEVTVPILFAEIAPRQLRGRIAALWQIFTAFGMTLGCAANLVCLSLTADHNLIWRLQLGTAIIPALPLLFLIIYGNGSESPHWLMRDRNYWGAYNTLKKLRGPEYELLAAKDFWELKLAMVDEEKPVAWLAPADELKHFFDLFTDSRLRRAMVASSILMISQQLCGINILAFYSSTIFAEVLRGQTENVETFARSSLLFTLGIGVINFLFAWPAFLSIDTNGRRPLLLGTIPLMSLFLLIGGFCHFLPDEEETSSRLRLGAMSSFVFFFVIAYSPGMGPVPFTYSAEVFPLLHRETGMSWAVAMNNAFAAGLAICFPLMYGNFHPHGAGVLFFFVGSNIFSMALVFLLMPETRMKALEVRNSIFLTSITAYAKHQMTKVLPWAIGCVFKPSDTPCPVLIQTNENPN